MGAKPGFWQGSDRGAHEIVGPSPPSGDARGHSGGLGAPGASEPDPALALVERAVRGMVEPLVERPEALTIRLLPWAEGIVVEISGDKAALGHVIGREGRRIEAVRTLLVAVGARLRRRIRVEVAG